MRKLTAGFVLGVLVAGGVAYANALYVNLNTNVTMALGRRQFERLVARRCDVSDGAIDCRTATLTCSASTTIEAEEDVDVQIDCDAD